jgi:RNA polymerase sigma-70 factor (ECF subfamily)
MREPDAPLSLAEERVCRAYEAGCQAHPGLGLSYERFSQQARSAAPKHGNGDYYLAVACDQGVRGAWERLQARYAKPLRALMRRRGASRQDISQMLDEVWGRLASPPRNGSARTRIGTYDGRGALLAWLSTVAWRRLADAWRAAGNRPTQPLREEGDPSRRSDPALTLADDEAGRLVGDVLERAWAALTTRELEVVVLKYRHGQSQQAIARTLRISPPRVTRLLQSAARRLRTAIQGRFEVRALVDAATSNQSALLLVLQRVLSRTDVDIGRDRDQGRDSG